MSAPAPGGFRHTVRRVVTDRGAFAVKDYDTTRHGASAERLADAARLEAAARAVGVATAEPVGEPVREVDGHLVRVHAWVDGTVPDSGPAPAPLAATMGAVLAGLHAAALPAGGPPLAAAVHPFGWARLVERATRAGEPWAGGLVDTLGAVAAASTAAADPPDLAPVGTHREVYAHNVVLTATGPVLVDWDGAGPWSPAEELATAAVEWAGGIVGAVDEGALAAVVAGYRRAGGRPPVDVGPELFARWLGVQVAWLDEHVRRALDPPRPGADAVARHRLAFLLPRLRRHVASVEAWVGALRTAIQ